ncbi:hypothetical protein FK873_gp009 [Micromonas pusilla virus SP1]|jgi:hypothetical protein|uniref:Uncharacterized protein n=1 Tax=Micromonas pusilla virus SP1 TaxID=373996 RepID=G9E5Y0_MPSP1|nr:hypothetical protein FK873_gp009 [Micromonas pusilla virus SP1]AET84807.1 hypothetical protein MPXG_00009 [Micromonas pusilla virus SP1]
MVPVNRETLLIVGTIICAIGVLYLFNELKKTREDVENFKGFSEQVVKHLGSTTIEPVEEEEEVEVKDDKSEE